jgi:hypothetical protein
MSEDIDGHAEFYAVLMGGTLSTEPADPATPLGQIQAMSQARPVTEADWLAVFERAGAELDTRDV